MYIFYFSIYRFVVLVLLSCVQKNTRLYHRRKKSMKTKLLVSFRLYFVITGDNLCISTKYYLC
jgi:hypothetical protein